MCKQNLHYYLLVSHFHMTFNLYPELLQKSFTHHHFFCLSCFFAIRCLWRWQLLFCLCISRATRDAPISCLVIITSARGWPITKWFVTYCYANQPKQCTGIRGVKHPILDVLPFFSLKMNCVILRERWSYQNISLFIWASLPPKHCNSAWTNVVILVAICLLCLMENSWGRIYFLFRATSGAKIRKFYL